MQLHPESADWEVNHLGWLFSPDEGDQAPAGEEAREASMNSVPDAQFEDRYGKLCLIELNGQQIAPGKYPSLERNVESYRALLWSWYMLTGIPPGH
ncbi:hypothetical protein SERLADRAFT_364524 [Serpula lacrymans var. lacrymans S7.9]|uniref:Uncharacterized protein n=1 Tax=Serpula lacrymans var. lacrymans (strain S7.9) TaxID=578457 RepID=F8NEF7_SERL9|nr:uncharacterized protein SERLADRAFT_364524 [Serpula lacrymans var. lacrymans S7.9]EGO30591.1 hypothetical protein SERLADRAFT_364524 [Serpula lacrymans var. lacrymans S7.9]